MRNFIVTKKYYFIILIFTFLFYGNSIKNNYSFSDYYIVNEQTTKGISAIPEIFTSRYFSQNKINYGYRPIVKATFALEHSLFGKSPHISHFINVLLFALLGILLFSALKYIFSNINEHYLLLVVLLFIAHPTQTEIVASLKNRDEIIAFLFGIISIKNIFRYLNEHRLKYLFFSFLYLVIGYYSKSTISILFAILPLLLYFSNNVSLKKGLLIFIVTSILLLIIGRLPNLFLEKQARELLFQEYPISNFNERLGTGFGIMLFYLKKLLIPYPLSFYYGYNTIPVLNFLNPISLISFSIFGLLGMYSLIKIRTKNILYFAILSLIISIFLFSNIITKNIAGIVADRYLFIPSLFFSFIVIYILFKILNENINLKTKINSKLLITFSIILIPYFIIDFNRNTQWKTTETLLESDINNLKNSAMANEIYATNRMGLIEIAKNNEEKLQLLNTAIKHYKISLNIYPEYKFSLSSLGNIYFIFYKDYKTASEYYEKYIKIDSLDATIIKNNGYCYDKLGNYNKALFYYLNVYKFLPNNVAINSLIANKYFFIGDLKTGTFYNEKIKKIDINSELPYINLANYYYINKDTTTALMLYKQALFKNPKNIELKNKIMNFQKIN